MLDKCNFVLTKKERQYHLNRIYLESKCTNEYEGEKIDSFAIKEFNTHNVMT